LSKVSWICVLWQPARASGSSVTGRNTAAWLLSRETLGIQFWKLKKVPIAGYHFVLEERIFWSKRIHVVPDRAPIPAALLFTSFG